jgi:serine/threonine-protein kinase
MSSSLPSGTRLGRYEIRSALGAGGMGEVYLAQDVKLDRKVALKILPAEVATHPDRMARFVQEAKAASALNHPNIITIYEVEQIDSVNFIATEFIDGETLRERINRTPLKLVETLDSAVQIATALSAAHAAGIVHRDLKPENIMLRHDGIAKVVDFGLAKLTGPLTTDLIDTEAPTRTVVKTQPGVVMGTAVYMSPEQARGLEVDWRTDIFSLGVLIYEMITGRLPYEGSNSNEIIASILDDQEPQPLARYTRDAPAELDRIVLKALRKDRDERYQTSKDLLLDLRNLKQQLEFDKQLERSASQRQSQSAGIANEQVQDTALSQTATLAKNAHQGDFRLTKRNSVVIFGSLFVVAAAIVAYLYYSRALNGSINSVAILPFVNLSNDPNTEYLSDGISESLINQLSQLPQLKVIARSSSFKYKGKGVEPEDVAKALGVRAVVTGRVERRGDELIISAELMDAREGTQVWGDQYDRKVSDLLSVQRQIVTEISNKLRLKLSGESQKQIDKHSAGNADSYELYLKGRYALNTVKTPGIKEALVYFQRAIEKDSRNGPAYAGLAECYTLLSLGGTTSYIPPKEGIPKAKDAALKAVEVDDTLAEAHTSLGLIALSFEWDWSAAEREFKRAIALNPNYVNAYHWYSHYLITVGRFDESLTESQRALALDPLDVAMNFHLGYHFFIARQYDLAIAQLQKTLVMDQNSAETRGILGSAYEQKGRFDEAIAELQKSIDLGGDDLRGSIGHVYAISGKRGEAEKLLSQLQEEAKQKDVSSYSIAVIYAGLGEKDQAFAFLEKAFAGRDSNIVNIKVDPEFDNLRSDPRFSNLLQRMRL